MSAISRGSILHYIKDEAVGLEIALDAMDSDDLQEIPIQNFHDIERQIGKMSVPPIMERRHSAGRGRRTSISYSQSSMTTASTFKVNTLPVIEESSLNNSRVSATEMAEYEDIGGLVSDAVRYLLFSSFIIPEHRAKIYWDRLIVAIVVYTATMTPFQMAFQVPFGDTVYLELLCTAMFMLDLWISIRTTFRSPSNGEYVIDSRFVSRRYLRSWFLCDVMASVPVFEILVFAQAAPSWPLRFLSLHFLRCSKLYRLRLLPPHSARTGFAALIVVLLFVWHWTGCIVHAVTIDTDDDAESGSTAEMYVSAFHWSMTAGMGWRGDVDGDALSMSLGERLCSCLAVLVAAILYSALFGAMSLILGEEYHSESLYSRHSSECGQFALSLHLSANLQRRIAALNRFEKEKVYGSNLEYLMRSCNFPNSVKYAILERTLKPVLADNGAFRFVTDSILLFLAENLSLSVSLPNEFLFKANDVMSRVYVVHEGLIRIFNGKLNEKEVELCRLTMGSHFGEVSFFRQHDDYLDERVTARSKLSTLSAVSHTFSVLHTLSYADFKEVLLIEPKNYKLFRAIAELRDKQSAQYDDHQLCHLVAARFNNNIGIGSGLHFEDHVDSVLTVQPQSEQTLRDRERRRDSEDI